MPLSQPGNAFGSARLGSADHAARNASWTTSSAFWKSRTRASAEPNATCWNCRVKATKACMSPPVARCTSCSWSMSVSSALKCQETEPAFKGRRCFLALRSLFLRLDIGRLGERRPLLDLGLDPGGELGRPAHHRL